ncbi:hypothetical protein B0F90DRAFT_1313952 [Multifurca ochricompacta]|uniref:HD/PDEase domain-containing protein n=1 Tax=Multifurca ochricompacta TaxID=376703 RepID=A0AAD4M725_9AGAM|nr:hypothetical protein B0F90DRAFT_1313952 [Multifurca ochricompacta]
MAATAGSEYPTPEEAVVVRAAEQFMEETMAKFSDPSHDPHHVRRVRRTALRLARSVSVPEGDSNDTDRERTPAPDLLTVELGALLHDVLDKKYVPPSSYNHDARAFFESFFRRAAETTAGALDLRMDGRAEVIVRIVENVSWSTEKRLRAGGNWGPWHETCVELHCVQDADRLDAIGAFGIMRCAAYSAVSKRALHAPDGDADQPHSAIQHFHDKLLHIRERLKTAPGRQMAEQRHKLMVDFLAAVEDEYGKDTQYTLDLGH